jgi:hypothetical protein
MKTPSLSNRFVVLVAALLLPGAAVAQEMGLFDPAPPGTQGVMPGATTKPSEGEPAQPAAAQPAEEPEVEQHNKTPGVIAPKAEPITAWDKWTNFIDREIDKVGRMDLYGVTAQLPKGYFKFKWDWASLNASQRFDSNHNRVSALRIRPTVQQEYGKPDPVTKKRPSKEVPLMDLDFGLWGEGGGHTIQMSYGLLGNLDWYIEIPFQYMEVNFNPRLNTIEELDADGNYVNNGNQLHPQIASLMGYARSGVDTWQFLRALLPKLARPLPAMRYKGEWLLGDINTGFSWNWFRNHRMSAALTPRVYFPTGRVADANQALFYGTGPQLDTGTGGWAIGFTQGYDVRIYNYSYWIDIIASTEFTTAYGFKQERNYPSNMGFPKEWTEQQKSQARALLAQLDPGGTQFPDLSDVRGQFSYTPGWSLSWTAQLQFQVAVLGLGVGYGVSHQQEPEIQGDWRFVQMSKSLQLLGQNTYHAIQLSASLTLLPLYIPAEIGFSWKKMVDGYQAIIFDDYWQVVGNFFVPIWPKEATPFPEQAFPEWTPDPELIDHSSWEYWGVPPKGPGLWDQVKALGEGEEGKPAPEAPAPAPEAAPPAP